MEKRKIIIKQIKLKNFKGAKDLTIKFDPNETNIYADNGRYKTTIADAISFVLFGKNSIDEEKFGIKTYDENGVVIPKLRHSVEIKLDVNGDEEVFERQLREKWRRDRGDIKESYKGDDYHYYSNSEKVQLNEFVKDISVIVESKMFKLLSDPLAFNRMDWKERRETLVNIAGNITDEEVLDKIITVKNKGDFNSLIKILNKNKSIEKYQNSLKGSIKNQQEELNELPIRIEEVGNNKPGEKDWESLEGQISVLNTELTQIDSSLLEISKKHEEKHKKQTELTKSIGAKKVELQNIENKISLSENKEVNENKAEHQKLSGIIVECETFIKTKGDLITEKQKDIDLINDELPGLREEFVKIKTQLFEFDENKSICPTCHQMLPDEDIEKIKNKLEGNFNEEKAKKLEENKKIGIGKKSKIDLLELEIKQAEQLIAEKVKLRDESIIKRDKLNIEPKQIEFKEHKEWRTLNNQIELLNNQIDEVKPVTDKTKIDRKKIINKELDALKSSLKDKETIEKADNRIIELKNKQNELAQIIADKEKELFAVELFEKSKMSLTEEKINSKFSIVKFRMFETQKNTIERPDCVTLVNGVPFQDANTASQINGGLDIIRVLSDFYKIYVPIVIDNRESVTEIIKMGCQIINLIKTEGVLNLTTSQIDSIKQQIEYFVDNKPKVHALNAKLNVLTSNN